MYRTANYVKTNLLTQKFFLMNALINLISSLIRVGAYVKYIVVIMTGQ